MFAKESSIFLKFQKIFLYYYLMKKIFQQKKFLHAARNLLQDKLVFWKVKKKKDEVRDEETLILVGPLLVHPRYAFCIDIISLTFCRSPALWNSGSVDWQATSSSTSSYFFLHLLLLLVHLTSGPIVLLPPSQTTDSSYSSARYAHICRFSTMGVLMVP